LLTKEAQLTEEVAIVNTSVPTIPADQTSVPTSTTDPAMAAIDSYEKLSEYLVSNTTHFQGDPNATVTIIEFSDYQ
jgi:protein-disulfide isomerase